MATTTPRIGLTKPDGTDLVDIAVLNTNFDKIDSNIASTKIQATKPATANAGDLWWDSDTGTLYLYYVDSNSAQWVAATSDPINIGVVASQAERDAQYPTPAQGMSVYRTDLGVTQRYYGLFNSSTNPGGKSVAGWYTDGQQYTAASQAERDARFPSPLQGDSVFRSDLGYEQTYYAAWNASTNPGGRTPAGWYGNQRNMGLVPIVPPTVNYSGGTATANTLGLISFTSVTSISLNNVFTTEYRNYRVIIEADASVLQQLRMRMRAAGADNGATDYQSALAQTQNYPSAAVTAYTGHQATFFVLGDFGTLNGHLTLDIFNPQISAYTGVALSGGSFDSTAIYRGYAGGLQHNIVSSYDGFTIFASTGNFTGTIQVFGYNA